MANFDSIVVGGVLKIKDTSSMKNGERYLDTYAKVVMTDPTAQTVRLKMFDGSLRWLRVSRVTDTFEVVE